jgi:peptidoglycan/LPS O-acetylase OafA/YrhL/CubicO group peptidase (beta-lactamase class C family)
MLYHADLPVVGGFLGVESFFVLSGFLITALLLADWDHHGRVRLKDFWWRRARRLIPALVVLLGGVLLLDALWLRESGGALARDTLAALGYVTNWYLILSGQSYFDAAGRPPLLQHLWSLAIEEQFYIFWPLIFAAGMRLLRLRGLLALTLLCAAGSAALMAALFEPGADPSRIYYGTDTRAAGLLLGCALGLVWSPGRAPALAHPRAGAALDAVGFLALAGLVAAYLLLNAQDPLLYRGGLQLVAVVTAVAVAAAVHPAARLLPRLLELAPLRWVGLRSYSLYLWHWPVFMVTRPGIDVPAGGLGLQLARFGLAFALAALSYAFVELPIRRGALGHVWRSLRRHEPAANTEHAPALWRPRAWYRRLAPAVATGALVLGAAYVGVSVSHAAVRGNLADAKLDKLPGATVDMRALVAEAEASAQPTAPAAAPGYGPPAAPTSAAPGTAERLRGPSAQQDSPATPAASPTFDPALAAAIQQILDAVTADGRIPGAVVSVRTADGAAWTGAAGVADRDSAAPMAPETLVRIGSLSKLFTTVVALQLVEEGALELDAPVERWLPGLLPDGDTITVRHLLQHRSGLYDYLEDRPFVSQAYQQPERAWAPEELVAYATGFPLLFTPGEQGSWDYSNTNFVVLAMLVEQVTGNTLAAEIRARIAEPLGLEATFSTPPDEVEGPMARGYSEGVDQTDVAMSMAFGTANIVTSMGDMRRFGEALFGGELLEPETLAEMQQFVDGKGRYNMPALAYGLGLMRNRLPLGPGPEDEPRPMALGRVMGHIGGFGGFRAAIWYAPETDILLVVSVNQAATDPNELATLVLDAALQAQGR